jgi:uncharacterized protein YjbJ (UPF0337 family)
MTVASALYWPSSNGQQSAIDSVKGTRRMKDSVKDKVEGAVHDAKGTLKEKVGHAANNPDLEAEGQDEKVAGKIQKKVGDIEKVFEK